MPFALAAQPLGMVYKFAHFELEEADLTFKVAGELVPLPIKPWATLLLLAQNAPDTVSKSELMDTVWLGRMVTEGVLTQVISRLRVLLGDQNQEVIKTVHGVGFRLTLPVSKWLPAASDSSGDSPADRTPGVALGPSTPLRGRPLWALTQALSTNKRTAVWLAERKNDHIKRVFKFAHDGAGLRALKRELSVTRVLQAAQTADGICPVLDADFSEAPFFTELPYFNGGNLVDFYDSHTANISEYSQAILIAIARAIADCHAVGIIHGDIKPKNILLELDADQHATARLADFGAALLLDQARLRALELSAIHQTGLVVSDPGGGTLAYAAPEILAGKAATVATDAYAFGVTAFQLLCGEFSRPLLPGWEALIHNVLLRQDISDMCQADPLKRPAFSEIATRLASLDARTEAAIIRAQELAEFEAAKADAARREQERALDLARIDYLTRRRKLLRWVTASLAILLLLAGTGFFLALNQSRLAQVQAKMAREQEAKARSSAAQSMRFQTLAEQTRDTLIESLISSANPFEGGNPDMPIASVLENTAVKVATNLKAEPNFAVPILDSFATVLLLGRHPDQSDKIYLMAIKIAATASEAIQATLHLGYAESLRSQGKVAQALGQYELAAKHESAAKIKLRIQAGIVRCLDVQGRTDDALKALAIADKIKLTDSENQGLIRDQMDMARANLAIQSKQFDRAERLLRAVNERTPVMRPILLAAMARSRAERGDFTGALSFDDQAIAALDNRVPIGNRTSLEVQKIRHIFLSGDVAMATTELREFTRRNANKNAKNDTLTLHLAAARLGAEIAFASGQKTLALARLNEAKTLTVTSLSENSNSYREIIALEQKWR